MNQLNCGTCQACCKHDVIRLLPEELSKFQHEYRQGIPIVAHKPNGHCIYLTEEGCGVHADKPEICRRFDCRKLFLNTPKSVRKIRILENPSMRAVYSAGKARCG